MVCRDFILPEFCKPCLFLSSIQFAQFIVPYPLPEFKTLWAMERMCRLYAQPTKEPTEFNLYAETAHFHVWLRLITRERDYNLYTYFFAK